MFEIWETGERPRFIADATTIEAALDKVDTMCRLRHDQAVAGVDGTKEEYGFEVRNPHGAALATLTFSPTASQTYRSVIVDGLILRDEPSS